MPAYEDSSVSRLYSEDGQILLRVSRDHAISEDWLHINASDLYRLWCGATSQSDRDELARLIDERFEIVEDDAGQREPDTDGRPLVRLEPAGRQFAADFLSGHAPGLHQQWSAHDDLGIRKEITNRVEALADDLEYADHLDARAATPTSAELALLRRELSDSLYGAASAFEAEDRYVSRRVLDAPALHARADGLRQRAGNADIPLTQDELVVHRSGQSTLQGPTSEASHGLATADGSHTELPGRQVATGAVVSDREFRNTLAGRASGRPVADVHTDVDHIRTVIAGALDTGIYALPQPTADRPMSIAAGGSARAGADRRPAAVVSPSNTSDGPSRSLDYHDRRAEPETGSTALPTPPVPLPPSLAGRSAPGPRR